MNIHKYVYASIPPPLCANDHQEHNTTDAEEPPPPSPLAHFAGNQTVGNNAGETSADKGGGWGDETDEMRLLAERLLEQVSFHKITGVF